MLVDSQEITAFVHRGKKQKILSEGIVVDARVWTHSLASIFTPTAAALLSRLFAEIQQIRREPVSDAVMPACKDASIEHLSLSGGLASFASQIAGIETRLQDQHRAPFLVRVRSLTETCDAVRVHGEPVSRGLLDLVLIMMHCGRRYLRSDATPMFQVPAHHASDLHCWHHIATQLEKRLAFPSGTILLVR